MASLKKELISGVFYTAISKYAGIIISLVVAGILARLISPEDFGVIAIATIIISFFNIFSDLGIAPAIIQNKELSSEDQNQIFSFTIWMGIGISILFFFLSWPISFFYKQEILLTICQLLAINLFFASANIVPNAILYKNKDFKFIAYRSIVIQCVGGAIGICTAILGAGLYALIINPIFSSICIFIISYKKNPLTLRYTLGIKSLRMIFNYSAYQFMFNVINYFSRNLDKLLIGKFMNMDALGYYEKSYRLMMLPLQNITHVISPVMHPIFSNFQNDLPRLITSYEKVIRILALIGFPLSILLYFSASEITLILFGQQWKPSIAIFQILTLSVGPQIILSTSGSIFQATNDTKSLFICGLFSTISNVTGILIGLFIFHTLEAIAWCINITFAINFMQCYIWLYKVTLNRNIRSLVQQFSSPILLTTLQTITLWPIYELTRDYPELISLILKLGSFAILSIAYVQISGIYNITNFIKSKLKR